MRQPYQVLILPYRVVNSEIKYSVFYTQSEFWQFVSGGGEEGETPVDTAIRELFEETQIKTKNQIVKLESVGEIPTSVFDYNYTKHWGDISTIPEYSFAIDIDISEILLSDEHLKYLEVPFQEALVLLKFESNKNALSELHQKLSKEGYLS